MQKEYLTTAALPEDADYSEAASSRSTTLPSTPGSEAGHHRGFFGSIGQKAKRFLGGQLLVSESATSRDGSKHRKISESRKRSLSSLDTISRRCCQERELRCSRSPSPSSAVDWRSQKVKATSVLKTESSHSIRSSVPYLVITTEYVVKLKSRADTSLFPSLSPGKSKRSSLSWCPEPVIAVPISSIVSIFVSEKSHGSYGFEVWWRSLVKVEFHHATFSFNNAAERDEQLDCIVDMMEISDRIAKAPLYSTELEQVMRKIQRSEEAAGLQTEAGIFPVVLRGKTYSEWGSKTEDDTKRSCRVPCFHLVIGAHLCFLVQTHQGKAKGSEPICKYRSFGLVSLENVSGELSPYEERFHLTFRNPIQTAVTLEFASRHHRRIFRLLRSRDRFLKPAWPLLWQTREMFHIREFKEPTDIVSHDNHGSVRRTLHAYLAAYQCGPVEWKINWDAALAPEFQLLPSPDRSGYTALQILAVLRALRYNDYFHSFSFRDIDMSILWELHDQQVRGSGIAYLSRSGVALTYDEIEVLRLGSVLHREFHALAFCCDNLRQINFTNCFPGPRTSTAMNLQFLTPVLHLLQSSSTRCSRLLLSGNALMPSDVIELADALETGTIQALDVSCCSLHDSSLKKLVASLSCSGDGIQYLNLADNPGRLPAHMVPQLLDGLADLRQLILRGTLYGALDQSVIPLHKLRSLRNLQELDLSKFHLNQETILDLEQFLLERAWAMDLGHETRLQRLVLNHCGLSGKQAARLFNAMGQDHGIHLFLSGNPIEDGIEHLVDAIRHSRGPHGLHLDMIDFKDEGNYALLMNSFADTKFLGRLSLVGTSPTSSLTGPCSHETIEALENLFARNRSIRFLDLSGFSDKLDESQLAKGFGCALNGLRHNTTMTHLRICNQRLQEDVGMLGTVIRENKALRTLDCQDNGFSMSSLQFLVASLEKNTTLLDFPFSDRERDMIWRNILSGLERGGGLAMPKTVRKMAPHDAPETLLRGVLNKAMKELDGYLARNNDKYEAMCRQQMPQHLTVLDQNMMGYDMDYAGASSLRHSMPGLKTVLEEDEEGVDSMVLRGNRPTDLRIDSTVEKQMRIIGRVTDPTVSDRRSELDRRYTPKSIESTRLSPLDDGIDGKGPAATPETASPATPNSFRLLPCGEDAVGLEKGLKNLDLLRIDNDEGDRDAHSCVLMRARLPGHFSS